MPVAPVSPTLAFARDYDGENNEHTQGSGDNWLRSRRVVRIRKRDLYVQRRRRYRQQGAAGNGHVRVQRRWFAAVADADRQRNADELHRVRARWLFVRAVAGAYVADTAVGVGAIGDRAHRCVGIRLSGRLGL